MKTVWVSLLGGLFLMSLTMQAQARTAESNTEPNRLVKSRGVIQYSYNIQEVQRDTDGDGEADTTMYEYNYVVIDPPATKGKILEALRKAKNADQSFNPADVETEQSAVEEKLAQLSQMSYAQIDTHIENRFGNLNAGQKASLKKLYKAVLALIKQLDLE